MAVVVIFLIMCVIFFGGIAAIIIKGRSNFRKRKLAYGVPNGSVYVPLAGGLKDIRAGYVFVWTTDEEMVIVSEKTGARTEIPFTNIVGMAYNQDIQTLTKGGGRSIGGAVVGGVIAGPVGAIVGGHKKTTTKTEDRSTVNVIVRNNVGMELPIVFKGGQVTYIALSRVFGA